MRTPLDVFNLVAFLAIAVVTTILVVGIKESANLNSAIVILKVAIVLVFIAIAGSFVLRHPAVARPELASLHPAEYWQFR